MNTGEGIRKDLTISVIVPVYCGGKDFQLCMEAMAAAMPQADEVIVVADGGTDHTPGLEDYKNIKLMSTTERGGPARARNLGARHATGDILFFVDADVIIEKDTIGKVVETFRNNPDISALLGSYDDAPSKSNFLSQYRNLLHHYVHQIGREDASTFWSGCGAILRTVFLEMGGFDATLYDKPAIEDIELGYRMKKAGYKIRLCKTIQVKHLKHWDAYSIIKTDFFQRALPWTQLIMRDRNFINDLNTDSSSRISVMCSFGIVAGMALAIWLPITLLAVLICSILLFSLNRSVYGFFYRKRGSWFALKVIPWHWLYYFYSGVAFAIGVSQHILGGGKTQEAGSSMA